MKGYSQGLNGEVHTHNAVKKNLLLQNYILLTGFFIYTFLKAMLYK